MQESQSTINQIQWLDVVKQEVYVPSGAEKKRAVVMYMLFGIVMMMGKSEMNVFEYYHLKQSIGRWLSFIMFFVVFAILLFLPVIKFLGIIPLFGLILILWLFIKQAWDWKYVVENEKTNPMQIFASIGTWLLNLFEISPNVYSSLNVDSFGENNQQLNQDVVSQPPVDDSSSL